MLAQELLQVFSDDVEGGGIRGSWKLTKIEIFGEGRGRWCGAMDLKDSSN